MLMYDQIKNDPYIINLYQDIDGKENKETFYAYHGLKHIYGVIDTVEKILLSLNCNSEYIENAKIAALLHDIGQIYGKENHEAKSKEMVMDYFTRKQIKLFYEEDILEAILLHRGYEETDNLMALVLILADKIDIKKDRITEVGKTRIGNRQYQFIEDIEIKVNNNKFIINFIVDRSCDKDELEAYYFTKKVHTAIKKFAEHINLTPEILWNQEPWML